MSATQTTYYGKDEVTIFTYVTVTVNAVSFAVCFLTFLALTALHIWRKKLVDRVSLRLLIWYLLANASFSLAQILCSVIWSNQGCAFSVWLYLFTSHAALVLTCCISFNLYYILVRANSHVPRWMEYVYLALAILVSLVISVIPLGAHQLGFNPQLQTCWFLPTVDIDILAWEWGTYSGPTVLFIFISTFFMIRVGFQLRKNRAIIGPNAMSRAITKAARRILIYPLLPLLTQILTIVQITDSIVNRTARFNLLLAAYTLIALQGLLAAIVIVVIDPSVALVRKKAFAALVDKFVIRYDNLKSTGLDINTEYQFPLIARGMHRILLLIMRVFSPRLIKAPPNVSLPAISIDVDPFDDIPVSRDPSPSSTTHGDLESKEEEDTLEHRPSDQRYSHTLSDVFRSL